MLGQIIGAATGALGGALGQQKEGGKTSGNLFMPTTGLNGMDVHDMQYYIREAMNSDQQFGKDPNQPANQVMGNPLQSQLFGKDGTLSRTVGEEQKLANQGFQLTPEDREAYGQASGDIARQFDQSEQSLANALSSRGLSSSGVAAKQFSGSQGNKMEQLAGMQRKIADDRMKNNMERLGQTRNFLSQMGNQSQNALDSQYNQNLQSQNVRSRGGQTAMDYLKAMQGQAGKNLEEEQSTQHESGLSSAFNSALGGINAAGGIKSMFGSGNKPSGLSAMNTTGKSSGSIFA